MTSMTRGPLPARVYWRRRVMVLGTALLLVFGIGRLLVGSSDASSPSDGAVRPAAAEASPTDSSAPETAGPTGSGTTGKPGKEKPSKTPEPLAQPSGPCADEDIAVTPSIKSPVAGRDVFVVLELRTIEAAACTWQVSADSLTVKITSGDDEIWSSRECPRAIRHQEVTVRHTSSTRVGITWSGRRSDEECSQHGLWALPGWYHVAASALAGEPSDLQFKLERPQAEHITETVPAEPKNDEQKKDEPKRR